MNKLHKKEDVSRWVLRVALVILFPFLIIDDFIKHPKEFKLIHHFWSFKVIWSINGKKVN
jgi:hypothetical protein